MNGGEISNNTVSGNDSGGGVNFKSGSFARYNELGLSRRASPPLHYLIWKNMNTFYRKAEQVFALRSFLGLPAFPSSTLW
jgi:hypothetical protein